MALGKQAKTLSKGQVEAVLAYLAKTRRPVRNRLIFLLSVKAGLRAKEIASLTWRMVADTRGEVERAIYLDDKAQQGSVGPSHPNERGVASCSRRILRNHMDFEQSLPHQNGEGQENVRSGHRQYVCSLVP
jgi:hypothetical protein